MGFNGFMVGMYLTRQVLSWLLCCWSGPGGTKIKGLSEKGLLSGIGKGKKLLKEGSPLVWGHPHG
jgi:hypothetical protein